MSSTSSDINSLYEKNDILCDEKIYNKGDAKKWMLKNHPDKRGSRATPLDVEKFKLVKKAMDKNIYCDDKQTRRKNKSTRSTKSSSGTRKSTGSTRKTTTNEEKSILKSRQKMHDCIRKRANWSNILSDHRFDKDKYSPDQTFRDMIVAAPKIRQMLDTIERLDEEDLKNHGKVFKHFIYSDVKEGGYGAKILASAFHADGYVDLIKSRKVPNRVSNQLYLRKTLEKEEEYQGFALLSSSAVYKSNYTQRLKKEVLNTFNKRPDNIHGKNIRFIILDSGFKEGVDLFDVKYVHILEPSLTIADLKQTIGRATRTCGQKGLHFQEGVGWELFVYNYYLTVPEIFGDTYYADDALLNTKGEHEGKLFKNKLKIPDVLEEFSTDDPAEKNLTHQLYNLAHPLSVDFDLTKPVHGDLKPGTRYEMFSGNASSSESQKTKIRALMGGAKKYALNFVNVKTINCNGRCGKRSTKDVPASQHFMERVYKKYNYHKTIGAVPGKNKRAYFCNLMKTNSQFCDDLNKEWANQMAIVPFVKSPADVAEMEIVPLEPEDKVDYNVFEDEPKIDKTEQKNALEVYRASEMSSNEPSDFSFAPKTKMSYKAMRKHVQTYFSQFKYPDLEVVNKCIDKGNKDNTARKNIVIDYSPSQNFVSHFFTPESAYKGMLLWHSVGTGKTCSAIATSSATFEKDDYTILWVTRNTLKSDVYKNIFDMICHYRIAETFKNGEEIPEKLGARTRMISKNWIKPISYKQFSNLLSGENEYYQQLVERNGKEDVLRKTLVIIDEAHKLYGGDLKASERPNMSIMEELIENSYKKSGKDSVKLLIMTATPFTNSPMELFKLLNLMVDNKKDKFPTHIKDFKNKYMNKDGIIGETGMKKLADQMAGYVSYLDRSKDASQFAQPVMIDVPVMMTHIEDPVIREHILKGTKPGNASEDVAKRKEIRQEIKTRKQKLKEQKKNHRETMKKHKEDCKEKFPSRKEKKDRDECLAERKARETELHERITEELVNEIKELEEKIGITKENSKHSKELRAKLREVKKSLLQEIQIAKRCKLYNTYTI
jgi:uncharacterized protein (UPF0335 family)